MFEDPEAFSKPLGQIDPGDDGSCILFCRKERVDRSSATISRFLPRLRAGIRGCLRLRTDGYEEGSSKNEAEIWPVSRVIQPKRFAYSCLARLPDGDVGCVCGGRTEPESGSGVGPYGVTLARFSLGWLEK